MEKWLGDNDYRKRQKCSFFLINKPQRQFDCCLKIKRMQYINSAICRSSWVFSFFTILRKKENVEL